MATAETQPAAAPPDERFWVKYSPNQELPISGLSSIVIHISVGVLMILLFTLVLSRSNDSGIPIESLSMIGDDANAGGGGDPNGTAVSDITGKPRVDRAGPEDLVDVPPSTTAMKPLPDVRNDLELPARSDADRKLPDASEAKNKLDDAGKTGPKNPGPPQSAGKGGPGAGGGKGAGTGPGEGAGSEPGSAGSLRQRRNKRWTMSFSTIGGQDYLKQLSALGAVLIAEYSDGTRTMFRKLDQSPVPSEAIDPSVLNRMVWVDDRPGAISELAGAMGLERTPNSIRCYFPIKLEAELLEKELAWNKRTEDQIHSTTFRVIMKGSTYTIKVVEQRLN